MEEPIVEVVIATMFDQVPACICDDIDLPGNVTVTVVNQCDREGVAWVDGVRWIHSKSRGLSVSRNIAINSSNAEYLLICDNDIQVNFKDLGLIVKHLDRKNISAYIIANKSPFGYSSRKVSQIRVIDALRVCSWQILLNNKLVRGFQFDETFGLGSGSFTSGEENIFLTDLLKAGHKIYALPSPLIDHPDEGTGWVFDDQFYDDRIGIFKRIFGKYALIYMFALFVRKRIVRQPVSLRKALSKIVHSYF